MNLPSLNKFKIKNKIIILSVIFVVFTGLVIYFIIFSSMHEIEITKENIINHKINEIKFQRQEKNADVITKKINEVEPRMKEYQKYFINKDDELSFIETLEGVATKHNVLQKINLQFPKQDEGEKKVILLDLNTVGAYKNILEYLSEIEILNYFVIIKNIEISRHASIGSAMLEANKESVPDSTQRIGLNIQAEVYFNQ